MSIRTRLKAGKKTDYITAYCRSTGWPLPLTEHVFHPTRAWRFDYCWPELLIALEIDGGVYAQGRHTRGSGYTRDCEKLNEAACMGYRVLRCTTGQVESGEVYGWLDRLLRWHGG